MQSELIEHDACIDIMEHPNNNKPLMIAHARKDDEWYTLPHTAHMVIDHIADNIAGKIIYMPCDTPDSAFWQAFVERFGELKLNGLIATSLAKKRYDYDGATVTETDIACGDILHHDNIAIAKRPDVVVVTNPPYSIIRRIIYNYLRQNIKFAFLCTFSSVTNFRPIKQLGWSALGKHLFLRPDGKLLDNSGENIIITNLWRYGKKYWHTGKPKKRYVVKADDMRESAYMHLINTHEIQVCGSYHDVEDTTSEYIAVPVTSIVYDIGWGTKYEILDTAKFFYKGKSIFARLLLRRLNYKKEEDKND